MKINTFYFHFENRLTFKVQAFTIICVKMHKGIAFLKKEPVLSREF